MTTRAIHENDALIAAKNRNQAIGQARFPRFRITAGYDNLDTSKAEWKDK